MEKDHDDKVVNTREKFQVTRVETFRASYGFVRQHEVIYVYYRIHSGISDRQDLPRRGPEVHLHRGDDCKIFIDGVAEQILDLWDQAFVEGQPIGSLLTTKKYQYVAHKLLTFAEKQFEGC